MANNFQVNVYQIGARVLARDQSIRMGFPSVGVVIGDCSTSPQRSLSSGYNVYGFIQASAFIPGAVNQAPLQFYVQETVGQLATIIA